jgi:hypothetical protein
MIYNPELGISNFSKDNYTAIIEEKKHSLGNITINDIDLNNLEIGFYRYNTTYPLIWDDYNSGELTMNQISMKFIETTTPAIVDNLDDSIEDRRKVTVKLNESLSVEYNNPIQGYLIYHSRLSPCRLIQFFVDNSTDVVELDSESDFSIDSDDFIIFDYDHFFRKWSTSNFTMHLIWEYDITIEDWELSQNPGESLLIQEKIQNYTVEFNYFFMLTGKKYNQSFTEPKIFADNIDVAFTVNLPDRNSLDNHILELDNELVNINDHLNANKTISVYLTNDFSPEQSNFSLNFTSLFIFEFVNPVGKTWAIDRLVEGRIVRERIYFPSLLHGPQHIYLKNLWFYEPTIYFEQIISNTSLFGRNVAHYFLNATITGKEGIKVKVPFLISGETCPFILKYASSQSLRVVVTDNIKMPLVGADVEIFYFGQKYGTYISADNSQPIAPGKTNENGEIILNDVPYGNYTIRVYQNGRFLKESIVSTHNEINYIYTYYPHFPLWIIIFGLLNIIILFFGAISYLKYKKTR